MFSSYIDAGHHRVEGWTTNDAFEALRVIKAFQDEQNIVGGAAEIGVHHGKFFFGLHNSLPTGSHSFAFDVFNATDNIDRSGDGNREIFESHAANFAQNSVEMHVFERDSLTLCALDVVRLIEIGGKCRVFSIDGGHTPEHVGSDFLFAQSVTANSGVIFVDDWLNPHWPGVNNGISKLFFSLSPAFVPFAWMPDKLLLTSLTWHDRYIELFKSSSQEWKNVKLVKVFGHDVIVFNI